MSETKILAAWRKLKKALAALFRYWNEKNIESAMIMDRVTARQNEIRARHYHDTRGMR